MYSIELYTDKNGKCELEQYLLSLSYSTNKNDRIKLKKIRMYINLLSEHGFKLTEQYIKKIDKELWELRTLKNRILFAGLYNNKFVLLSFFNKQTRKTPKSEIEKAHKLLEDYIKRSV